MTFQGKSIDILPRDGVNNGFAPVAIGDRQAPDCRNVRFRENDVHKRDGSSRLIATAVAASPISGIFELSQDNGTLDIVAFAGTAAARKNGTAWSSILGGASLTAGTTWRGAALANLLVLMNNVDGLYKYAGGATNIAALGGSPPSAALDCVTYHNYLMLINTLESAVRRTARLRWSDLNNAESWGAANFADIINAGGQAGVGFGSIGDQLYAFLSGSIWQISYTGDDVAPFSIVRAHPSIGAISKHAILGVNGVLFFAGYKGIYMFDGSLPQYISKPVEGTWRTINYGKFASVVGVVNERDNEVRFSIATASNTVNDTTLVYDYVRDAWSLDNGYTPSYWASLPNNLPLQPVYGDPTGLVMQINTNAYVDDANAIVSYITTKPNDFGDFARRRKVRQVLMVVDLSAVSGSVLQIRSGYDLATVTNLDPVNIVQDSSSVWDTAVWDVSTFADESQAIVRHYQTGSGRLFQLEVRNVQAQVPMRVSELYALVKGDADE